VWRFFYGIKVVRMKKETKKDIKDTFDNWLIAAVCMMVVFSLNDSCSRTPDHIRSDKTEKVQTVRDSIVNCVNVNHQKTR